MAWEPSDHEVRAHCELLQDELVRLEGVERTYDQLLTEFEQKRDATIAIIAHKRREFTLYVAAMNL